MVFVDIHYIPRGLCRLVEVTGNVLQAFYIVDFIPYMTGFYILMPPHTIKLSVGQCKLKRWTNK